MSENTNVDAMPQTTPENETPAASDTSAPGGLTLSRPGETAPQTRRGKRTSVAPTGGEGIPAGTNGRLRIIHN